MKQIYKYRREDNCGGILIFDNGIYEAFTEIQYKKFKTLKGAQKWMNAKGYKIA